MKIALIGYGAMGKLIRQLAVRKGHEIMSVIDLPRVPLAGGDPISLRGQ